MVEITRRALLAAVPMLALAGCSSAAQVEEAGPLTAEVGEPVTISTSDGDITVTVEGFERNAEMTEDFRGYGQIESDQCIGLLLLVVENVSYDDGSGFIQLPDLLYTEGEDGVSLSVLSSSLDVNEYEGVAGGVLTCAEGQSKRIALFHAVSADLASVTVVAGDYEIPVEVTEG